MMERHDHILQLLPSWCWLYDSFQEVVSGISLHSIPSWQKILGGVSGLFPFSISGVFYVLVSCLLLLYPIVCNS